jgi:hypothetical protein
MTLRKRIVKKYRHLSQRKMDINVLRLAEYAEAPTPLEFAHYLLYQIGRVGLRCCPFFEK